VTAMNTNSKIHLIEIPIGGWEGFIWNRLHSEREDICEAMLKEPLSISGVDVEADSARTVSTKDSHRELQERLRKIDDALDRLMSGSYGNCSKCSQWIGETELDLDPALALCVDCSEHQSANSSESNDLLDLSEGSSSSEVELTLETLRPFDTILVRTLKSVYRILLLDPKTGRALVEGGQYLIEPREAYLSGSHLHDALFLPGSIVVGCRLEMWIGEKFISTSRVQSLDVKHHDSAESIEPITEAVH